ncbi:MAG TPA: hypothetical protein ENO01_02915, partial [Candidatus Marinimicrobia bacterium]|nr:hypothetical protein [Candidatus Neomarinimicrobiota bacterium]
MMVTEPERKSLHILSGIIPLSIYIMPEWFGFSSWFGFTSRQIVLLILGSFAVPFIILDVGRRFIPAFRPVFQGIAGHSMRYEEEIHYKITGASWQFISFWVVIWFFKPDYAVPACLLLSVSDAAAALVGKKWGKRYWFNDHTLIGTSAFIISGLLIFIIGYPHLVFWKVILVVVTTALAESLLYRINDNFTVPLISAIMLY